MKRRIDFNLIPKEHSKVKASVYIKTILIAVLAMAFIFVVGIFLPTKYLNSKEAKQASLSHQKQESIEDARKFDELMLENQFLNAKRSAYENIKSNTIVMSDVLKELKKALPKGANIDRLSINQNELSCTLTADSNKIISIFLENLKNSEMLNQYLPGTINSNNSDGSKNMSLTISLVGVDDGGAMSLGEEANQ